MLALVLDRHYERKGLAYCETHYHQLFGNLCQVCNQVTKPVLGIRLRTLFGSGNFFRDQNLLFRIRIHAKNETKLIIKILLFCFNYTVQKIQLNVPLKVIAVG